MLEVGEWYYRQLKGRIAGHVARGSDRPAAIVKSARTIVARGDISPEALARILEEVQIESVQPFVGPPWNQPERFGRFRLLKSSLSA
jgi:hypothetical protein